MGFSDGVGGSEVTLREAEESDTEGDMECEELLCSTIEEGVGTSGEGELGRPSFIPLSLDFTSGFTVIGEEGVSGDIFFLESFLVTCGISDFSSVEVTSGIFD